MAITVLQPRTDPGKAHQQLSPQELKSFCDERLQWALSMYPEQLRPSLETQGNYVVEWLELSSEVGPERFSAALVRAVRDSDYFPVVSKIRQHAGMGSKQQTAAGASAAWMWLQEYLREWPLYEYSDGVRQPKGAPTVPPRINHAARLVGGLMRIQNVTEDALPFVQRDFCVAWENYEQSAAAYHDLQLQSPLLPKLLAATNKEPGAHKRNGDAGRSVIEAAAKPIPPAPKSFVHRGALTEAQIADLKRRALEVEARYKAQDTGEKGAQTA